MKPSKDASRSIEPTRFLDPRSPSSLRRANAPARVGGARIDTEHEDRLGRAVRLADGGDGGAEGEGQYLVRPAHPVPASSESRSAIC